MISLKIERFPYISNWFCSKFYFHASNLIDFAIILNFLQFLAIFQFVNSLLLADGIEIARAKKKKKSQDEYYNLLREMFDQAEVQV